VSVYRIREESVYVVHNMKNIVVIIGIFYSGSWKRSSLRPLHHPFISSPGPTKGPGELLPSLGVHRLLSVVCKLFTFQASSPKPLGQLEPNLAGMFLGWSSTKLLFLVPVGYSTWLPGPIICSVWLKFQRSSSLKLMNWLNPNCKWMIIGRSFTKLLFFMLIGNPRWAPPQDID
jgi:hypothetical protein